MHMLRVQPLSAGQIKQRFKDIFTTLARSGVTGNTKLVSTSSNINTEASFDLSQVFIKLATQVGQAVVIGGFQDNVPGNINSIQW